MRPGERLEMALAIALAIALLFSLRDFVTDDAFITLRYARNLADGHGLCWNPDEPPLEGYSNALHVAIAAAAIALDLPPLPLLRTINALAVVAAVLLVRPLAARMWPGDRFAPLLASLVVAAHVPLAYWASSGLETALYGTSLLVGVLLATDERAGARLCAAVPFFAAVLTRPEGPLGPLALASALALRRDGGFRARHGPWLLAVSIAIGLYFLAKLLYFGDLLPNPVRFKAGSSLPGATLIAFVRDEPLLVAAAFAAPLRGASAVAVPVAVVATAHALALFDARLVVAQLHRFLVPIVPLVAAVAAGAPRRLARRTGETGAAIAVGVVLVGYALLNPETGVRAARLGAEPLEARIVARLRLAQRLDALLQPTAVIAAGDVGVLGYVLPHPIVDNFGLNDRAFTRELDRDRKRHAASVLARRPAAIVLISGRRAELRPVHKIEARIAERPEFATDYEEADRILSTADGYHYFVYLRRDGAGRRPVPVAVATDVLHGTTDLAMAAEALAASLRPGPD